MGDSGSQDSHTLNNNYLFYKTPNKYLINIGKNNYFIPDNAANNNNWEWLKTFTENVIQDISNKKRQFALRSDNEQNSDGVIGEKNRDLKEIKYYINRYIYENDTKIPFKNDYTIYAFVYNHLNDILKEGILDKLDNSNIMDVNDANNNPTLNIDKIIKKKIIKNNKSKQRDEYSVYINNNSNTLEILNNELNNFNYNYIDDKTNDYTTIDFNLNNYIYSGLNDDITLYNIKNKNYEDFLIDENIQREEVSLEYNEKETNLTKILINLILSIKNRYDIILKNNDSEINVYDKCMSRGVFFYYKTILDKLVKKFKTNDINNTNRKFIPISIPIMIYDIIFKYIYNKISDNQVIHFKELNKGQNEMSKFATLFYVEMKPFLDQYKASDTTQKVKFFCNINDNINALNNKAFNKYGNFYVVNDDGVTTKEKEAIIKEIEEKIPINISKQEERVFSIKNSQNEDNNYDILKINSKHKDEDEDEDEELCKLDDLKFNKIFDKTEPLVMAPYIAASNVINNYEGLMLFTFGYSGVGKSYTIFGSNDKPGGKPGILYSIFNSIQDIDKITVKIYEIYGMGLNNTENFNKNVYQKYINHEIELNGSKYNIGESKVVDNSDSINGIEISEDKLSKFLEKLNSINDNIANRRGIIKNDKKFDYNSGGFKHTEGENDNIHIKTIKKTKNNPDSSRSILCYELIIEKNKQNIPFIVVDLPGKEIIKDSFGEEGEALLKINNDNINKEDFLTNNFSNILLKIKNIEPEILDDLFSSVEINSDDINLNIFSKKNRKEQPTKSIKIAIDKLLEYIEFENDTGSKLKKKFIDIIKFIPNFLKISQYHEGYVAKGSSLNKNYIYAKYEKIFLNISQEYSEKFQISNNNAQIKKTHIFKMNFLDDNIIKLLNNNEKDEYLSDFPNNNFSEINFLAKAKDIYFGIDAEDLDKLYNTALQTLNKFRLIKIMINAINHPSNQQNNNETHPILKLTHILDRINDNEYIKDYSSYAEECFKYTKSAEGLFINENINGIMQLMINKKDAGIDNMETISGSYDESKMFYNEENQENNFNNTLVFENLYNIYDNKSGLRKIDNIYAFFVVANISNNKRIKQKLICNATKDGEGKYRRDLDWDCDEEALDKEREEALIKQKEEIDKERRNKEQEKYKFIEDRINELNDMSVNNINQFNRIKRSDGTLHYMKKFFNNNQNNTRDFLNKFNKNHGGKKDNLYIKQLAIALYNEIEKIRNKNLINSANKNEIESIKTRIGNDESEIIRNFRELDTNGNGEIDIYEFKSAIKRQLKRQLGEEPIIDEGQIILMFNNIDKDRSGSISLQEFIDDIKKQYGGISDRELYIREMCKTQIALFKELKNVINTIVDPDSY